MGSFIIGGQCLVNHSHYKADFTLDCSLSFSMYGSKWASVISLECAKAIKPGIVALAGFNYSLKYVMMDNQH